MVENVVTRTVTVCNRQGIHARPAAMIAQLGRRFDAKIELVKEHERAECTDVLHVLALGVMPGQSLTLEASGAQAAEAAEALARLIHDELPRIED
jgi:phosphotransferase system HPr (HPr) family protein